MFSISVVDWPNARAEILHDGLRHRITLVRGSMPTLQQIDEKIRSCAKPGHNYYCFVPENSKIVLISQAENIIIVEYRER